MNATNREVLLQKVASPIRGNAPRTGASEALSQDEIGLIIEGLSFAQRPVHAASEAITRQFGLGPRGAYILVLISNGVAHPMDLATVLRTSRSLITSDLARLSEAGLIDAAPGEADRRKMALSLTPAGSDIRQQIRAAMARIVTGNLAGYSPDQVRLFAQMLSAVRGEAAG